jgi:hypothetical protein
MKEEEQEQDQQEEEQEEQEKGTGDEVAEVVGGFLSEGGGEDEEALETHRAQRISTHRASASGKRSQDSQDFLGLVRLRT